MNRSHVIEALRAADWSNTPIGNKALIQAAIEHLEAQPSSAFRPAQVISYRPGVGEVTIYVAGRVPGYMNIGDTVYVSDRAPVEQAGGDERAGLRAAAKWHRGQRNAFEAEAEMHRQRYENTNRPDSLTAEAEHHRRLRETASAMAANHHDYAAGFEEMARAALAQHSPAPTLRAAIDTANDRFEAPVAKWGTDLAGEEERPEVVAFLMKPDTYEPYVDLTRDWSCDHWEALMIVAQHERIVGALRAEVAQARRTAEHWKAEKLAADAEIDAVQARVAELEKQEPACYVGPAAIPKQGNFPYTDGVSLYANRSKNASVPLYTAPVAQAQHSVPEGWMLVECGIWTQEQVDEMQKTVARFRNSEFVDDRALAMAVADAGQCKAPEISLAELLAAAPGKEVGHE
ncbi:TPA: hypothetical protein L4T12_004924 [Pseudomonas aeruginosa]|nr:hypothetical protein [Pseudomonas aeruginosa]